MCDAFIWGAPGALCHEAHLCGKRKEPRISGGAFLSFFLPCWILRYATPMCVCAGAHHGAKRTPRGNIACRSPYRLGLDSWPIAGQGSSEMHGKETCNGQQRSSNDKYELLNVWSRHMAFLAAAKRLPVVPLYCTLHRVVPHDR